MDYRIIRSNRKTIGLEVTREGVTVRSPRQLTDAYIAKFVQEHQGWIQEKQAVLLEQAKGMEGVEPLTMDEIRELANQALQVIPERVRFYAPKVGVSFGKITIRNQTTRWGSCSAKGNLNFNCLLMLAPPEVLDCIVVHELCHRKEMNHSKRFYEEVLRVYPEYWTWQQWLKDNGPALMMRMTGSL